MTYEAKYRKYMTKSQSRFAERGEILAVSEKLDQKKGHTVSGIPLYYEKDRMYVDNSDSHTVVVGPTGCKKSRVTVFPTVCTIIEAGESAVVNDPKGEIYRRTASLARGMGADVRVINFRDPIYSDHWNPLAQAYRLHTDGRENEAIQSINDFVNSIVTPSLKCTNDRYWIDTAAAYLNALAMILMDSVPEEYYNLSNLIKLSYEDNRHTLSNMLDLMDQSTTAAFGLHTVLDLQAEKTSSCVFSSLLSMLSPFIQNVGLLNCLCDNNIDIGAIGERQTIIYVIYPDEKNSLSFLVNAFFTQCYETLVAVAAAGNDRLPLRVNFVLDEFSNLPAISNFDNRISEARSRNIRYFLFIQSYDQLRQKYHECAETIISNCNNWVCFGSKEIDFLNKLSAVCGREVDYNGVEHDLISPFDMQHLIKKPEGVEVLIVKQGMYPYVVELPDFDYIKRFRGMSNASLRRVSSVSNAKFFTFSEWTRGIDRHTFKFPYRKKSA